MIQKAQPPPSKKKTKSKQTEIVQKRSLCDFKKVYAFVKCKVQKVLQIYANCV